MCSKKKILLFMCSERILTSPPSHFLTLFSFFFLLGLLPPELTTPNLRLSRTTPPTRSRPANLSCGSGVSSCCILKCSARRAATSSVASWAAFTLSVLGITWSDDGRERACLFDCVKDEGQEIRPIYAGLRASSTHTILYKLRSRVTRHIFFNKGTVVERFRFPFYE